jgi:hypothetical protein
MVTCQICDEVSVAEEILAHLELEHGIPKDEIAILEERREVRRKDNQELLATWKEIAE